MNLSSMPSSSSAPSSSAPLKKRMTNAMYLNSKANTNSTNNSPQRDNEQAAAAALASLCSKPKSPASSITAESSSSSSDGSSAPSTPISSAVTMSGKEVTVTDTHNGYLSSSDSSTASMPLPRPVHAPPVSSMMVDHTYRDYSCVEETMLETLDAVADGQEAPGKKSMDLSPQERKLNARKLRRIKSMFTDAGNVRKNSGGVTKPFPEKLMEVLSRGDIDTIIQWLPHGRAFIVLNPQVFVKEVLPRFFKQSKFMSFTRQLNLWGFKRITKGRDAGAYYHQLFLRGRPRLCMRMRRQKIKGTGIKLTPNPETEPNFYKISEAAPLPAMEQKKEYEPLPPLRKVGNNNTNNATHHANSSSRNNNNSNNNMSSNSNAMNVPFDYASLLSGMDRNGRVGGGVVSSSNVNRQMQHAMPNLTHQQHRRVSAPPALGNMRMPVSMPMQQQEDPRRLSTGSNGSSMTSRMDMLSPSAHDRSRSAAAAAAMRSSVHSGGFNAAAAVANPHGLLQEIRGMEMTVSADQRLSAAQELEVLAQALREKAAADKQQQTIVSAQRLLSQMSDPRKPPSPRSVEQLKSHLLAAAHSLDSVTAAPQEQNLLSRQGAGGHAHSHFNPMQQLPRHRQQSSVDPYNSLLQQQHQQQHRVSQQQAHSNVDPLMNQIPNALMSALDQTKMVAAAAQEQSALLQRFAQNLEMRRQNGGAADAHGGLYNPHGRPHM